MPRGKKPPPEPRPEPVWYCGLCAGRTWIWCPWCVVGCADCNRRGRIVCPECKGGDQPVPPPDFV